MVSRTCTDAARKKPYVKLCICFTICFLYNIEILFYLTLKRCGETLLRVFWDVCTAKRSAITTLNVSQYKQAKLTGPLRAKTNEHASIRFHSTATNSITVQNGKMKEFFSDGLVAVTWMPAWLISRITGWITSGVRHLSRCRNCAYAGSRIQKRLLRLCLARVISVLLSHTLAADCLFSNFITN